MHPEYFQTDIYLLFPSLHPRRPLPFVRVTVFRCFVQVLLWSHSHCWNIYLAETEGQRSVSPRLERCKHALFQGPLVRAEPSASACCWSRRHLQSLFPGRLRWGRLRGEKEPPLETIPPIKNQLGKQRCSAWQGRAAQVNKSVTTDGFSYSTNQLVF